MPDNFDRGDGPHRHRTAVRETLAAGPDCTLYITARPAEALAGAAHGIACLPAMNSDDKPLTNFGQDIFKLSLGDFGLQGHPVYLVFDEAQWQKPRTHKTILDMSAVVEAMGGKPSYILLPADDAGMDVGLDGFLEEHSVSDLRALVRNTPPAIPDTAEEQGSVAERLVRLMGKAFLFHNERGQAYVYYKRSQMGGALPLDTTAPAEAADPAGQAIAPDEPFETRRVRSTEFRGQLLSGYFKKHGKIPGAQATENAMRVMEAKALDGPEVTLSVRTATDADGNVWHDLADSTGRAMYVTAEGVYITQPPGPLFRRHAGNAPQVVPIPGGNLNELRLFVNVRDDQTFLLLTVWLVASMIDWVAHAILVVSGEQGSGKSLLVRMVRTLIDPSRIPLCTLPRDVPSWIQVLDHSWVVCADNVSGLSNEISDAACRAVTGDGFEKRALYTDDESILYCFRRVIALNGIEVVAERPDLLERALLMPLMPITKELRRSEAEILAEFEAARPRLVGALCDLLSGVLRELPGIKLASAPRLVDFARVGVAVERVLNYPPGAFLAAFAGNAADQNDEAIHASPIGAAVFLLMNPDNPRFAREEQDADAFRYQNPWRGTASSFLRLLNGLADEDAKKSRVWPKTPRLISGMLRRIAPNLRAVGIEVEFDHGRERIITLTKRDGEGMAVVTDAPTPPTAGMPAVATQPRVNTTQTDPYATQAPYATNGITGYRVWNDADDGDYPPPLHPAVNPGDPFPYADAVPYPNGGWQDDYRNNEEDDYPN